MIGREQEEMKISIREEEIEQVTQFKYLGVIIDSCGSQEADIEERLEKAVKTYHAMRNGFVKKKEVSTKTKTTTFKVIFRPIITFGCESWVLTRRLESRLQATEMKFLRGVRGVSRLDRVRNTDIRQELGLKALTEFIEQRQLSWWGHLQRMSEDRQVKRVWEARVKVRRRRGRPSENWESAVAKIIQGRGKTLHEARTLAMNRRKWAEFVHR